jgi:hypothetical protein
MYTTFIVKGILISPMLGTVSLLPNIHKKHLVNKVNELIADFRESKAKLQSKYVGAKEISAEQELEELMWVFEKLEDFIGRRLSDEERAECLKDSKKFLKDISAEDPSGITGFFYDREKNLPFVGGWMISGFLKNAAEVLTRAKNAGKEESKKDGKMWSSIASSKRTINEAVSVQRKIYFDTDVVRNPDGTPKYLERSLRAMTNDGPRVCLAASEMVDEGAKFEFTIRTIDGLMTSKILHELFAYGSFKGLGQWRNADWGQFEILSLKEVKDNT